MQAVILVGGKGTRLRPLTENLPKPMIPINGKPFLTYQIEHLKKCGVTEIILCCGYLSEKIREYYGDGEKLGMNLGVKITYVVEEAPLGTGGAIKYAETMLADKLDEIFLVLNGDSLFAIDFGELISIHKKNNALATIALKKLDKSFTLTEGKGLVKTNKDHKVISFNEKPGTAEDVTRDNMFISSGMYCFSKESLSFLKEGVSSSLEYDLFPQLIKTNRLYSLASGKYFVDMGTHETLRQLENDIERLDL